MGRKTIIVVIISFVLGLALGFALYNPVTNATNLNAGGGVSNGDNGIWTGTEWAYPWLWTDKQWGIFSNCVSNPLDKSANKGTQRWSKCAAKAIAGSPFTGKKTGSLFTSDKVAIANMSFTVSGTGAITGKVIKGAELGSQSLPVGAVISGYINPGNDVYFTNIGKLRLRGTVINTGKGKSGTDLFVGNLIDQDSPKVTFGLNFYAN